MAEAMAGTTVGGVADRATTRPTSTAATAVAVTVGAERYMAAMLRLTTLGTRAAVAGPAMAAVAAAGAVVPHAARLALKNRFPAPAARSYVPTPRSASPPPVSAPRRETPAPQTHLHRGSSGTVPGGSLPDCAPPSPPPLPHAIVVPHPA